MFSENVHKFGQIFQITSTAKKIAKLIVTVALLHTTINSLESLHSLCSFQPWACSASCSWLSAFGKSFPLLHASLHKLSAHALPLTVLSQQFYPSETFDLSPSPPHTFMSFTNLNPSRQVVKYDQWILACTATDLIVQNQ